MTVLIVSIIAALVVIIDRISKIWAVDTLYNYGDISGIPGILNFVYVENKGAAFGMLQNFRWVFVVVSVIFIVALMYVVIKNKITNKAAVISIGLILGGTVGNLIDRVINGYVVDFLSLTFFPPVCNIADYSLTIGVIILAVYLLFFTKKTGKANMDSINKEDTIE